MSAPTICRACGGKIEKPTGWHMCEACHRFIHHLVHFIPKQRQAIYKRLQALDELVENIRIT